VQLTSQLSAVHWTPEAHAEPTLHATVQVLPVQVTAPFWQVFWPSHVMAHRSVAVHSTPAAHAEP
jgi:hypothetical protein